MAEENSAASSSNSRKQPRANSGLRDSPSEGRPPPTKRARKAINCEPCRASKLKCDRYVLWIDSFQDLAVSAHHLAICYLLGLRNRPCSSCVLRGMLLLQVLLENGYRTLKKAHNDPQELHRNAIRIQLGTRACSCVA